MVNKLRKMVSRKASRKMVSRKASRKMVSRKASRKMVSRKASRKMVSRKASRKMVSRKVKMSTIGLNDTLESLYIQLERANKSGNNKIIDNLNVQIEEELNKIHTRPRR